VSFLDRILDGLNSLFYSKKKSISLSSRTLAVAVVMMTVTTVIPTLAGESNTPLETTEIAAPEVAPEQQQSEGPETDLSASTDGGDSSTEVPSGDSEENSDQNDGEATTEEEEKVNVVTPQPQITFRAPFSVAVDPRARVAFLPQINIAGGARGMLCISSNALVDIGLKNYVDVGQKDVMVIAGDNSPFVRIAGDIGAINSVINSAGGIKVGSFQGRLSASAIQMKYIELSGLDASPEFCSKAGNSQMVGFRALGLQLDTVKTRVDFNKPSGR
jgi:cytoskeletal protein RodZ